MIRLFVSFILITTMLTSELSAQTSINIFWKKIATIPSSRENQKSLGLAGAINGVNNNVFIVAGGSNFPNKLPWEGGRKAYYNSIFVLEKKGEEYYWNKKVKSILPEPVAYCGNVSTPSGIVYVGGENENGILSKCFLLTWNAKENQVSVKPLPDLPLKVTNVAITNIDNVVYAAGGDKEKASSNTFFCLNLQDENLHWQSLPDLPIALANATAIAQNASSGKQIFIIGGRSKNESGISDLHNTTFAFDPEKQQWRKCADISDGVVSTNLSAAAGVALGGNKILITGGDNGKIFHQIEILISKIKHAKTPEEKEKLTAEKII